MSNAARFDNSFTDGQTLLLVGRYTNSAIADGDAFELIGYDTADAVALPSVFNPADPNAQFSYKMDNVDIDYEDHLDHLRDSRGPEQFPGRAAHRLDV